MQTQTRLMQLSLLPKDGKILLTGSNKGEMTTFSGANQGCKHSLTSLLPAHLAFGIAKRIGGIKHCKA